MAALFFKAMLIEVELRYSKIHTPLKMQFQEFYEGIQLDNSQHDQDNTFLSPQKGRSHLLSISPFPGPR